MKTASAELLIANISADVVTELAVEFERVLKTGSIMILSGFTECEVPEGLRIVERLQKDQWVCLVALTSGEKQPD